MGATGRTTSRDGVNSPSLIGVDFATVRGGSEYGDEYEQVVRYVCLNRYHGRPTRLKEVVRYVYGDEYDNTEYQRVRRFINRTDYLTAETESGFVHVDPTPDCFTTDALEAAVSNSQKRRTGSGLGCKSDKLAKTEATTETQSDEPTHRAYPKDRLNRLREKVVQFDGVGSTHDYRSEAFQELTQYRENTKDKFTLLKRRISEDYLLLPYRTRFNDMDRAGRSYSRFKTALQRAAEDFRTASVLSLTVEPGRFGSHAEATEEITDAVNNLKSYLRYQVGDFEVLSVFDFQGNGLPHYHIVLFGVDVVDADENETGRSTVSESQVREYWDENADIGSEVAVRPAWTARNGAWLLHDDGDRVSLRYYLGKRMRELLTLAETPEPDLWDAVEDDDLELWRHALFWASGKRYCSVSDGLRESDDDDGLPYAPAWEYVGTLTFDQVPQYVLEKATICRRSRTATTAEATPG